MDRRRLRQEEEKEEEEAGINLSDRLDPADFKADFFESTARKWSSWARKGRGEVTQHGVNVFAWSSCGERKRTRGGERVAPRGRGFHARIRGDVTRSSAVGSSL